MHVVSNRSFAQRMMGAAQLKPAVYEEVEHDSSATAQAAGVVAIVAVCAAIGGGAGGWLGAAIGAVLSWLLMAGIVYIIGDKMLGGTATWGEMLRTMGFAQAPGVLYILAIIPILGWVVRVVVWFWILVAAVIAIRQGMDFGTGRAILTGVLAVVAVAIVNVLLLGLF